MHRSGGAGRAGDPGRAAVGQMRLIAGGAQAAGQIQRRHGPGTGDQDPLSHRTSAPAAA